MKKILIGAVASAVLTVASAAPALATDSTTYPKPFVYCHMTKHHGLVLRITTPRKFWNHDHLGDKQDIFPGGQITWKDGYSIYWGEQGDQSVIYNFCRS